MGFLETYHYYNREITDKRSKDWYLVGSPIPIILMSFAYLYFILGCGPRYMKDKQPYSLRTFIRFYNIFQIVTNALIVYHSFDAGWYEDYFIYCVVPDVSMNPKSYKILCIFWYALLLKLFDYIETFMFVLRKKNRQISFLHVYHHISTAFLVWLTLKYWGNGLSLTIIIVNCCIHVIMYTYYLLSSFGPTLQPYLQPIKPMITIAQMDLRMLCVSSTMTGLYTVIGGDLLKKVAAKLVLTLYLVIQFLALILYAVQGLLPFCSHQFYSAVSIIINLAINFILFYNFYRTTYKSQKSKKK